MECERFLALVERYLTGQLRSDERDDLEGHYFACDDCFLALQIRERLLSKAVKITLKERFPDE